MTSNTEDRQNAALRCHRQPRPGRLEGKTSKPLTNQSEPALVDPPEGAAACSVIAVDPAQTTELTVRGNLVTIRTAVLGLGNIGPLASKLAMEGKAVLFKNFVDIDVFDIEIKANTSDSVVEIIDALDSAFGGVNLEEINGPECFEIEAQLNDRINIPVFHDDQHGPAIIVGAAASRGIRA